MNPIALQAQQIAKSVRKKENRGTAAMREIGELTKRAILAELEACGPGNRSDIGRVIGLSRQTVSRHVAEMVSRGELVKLGRCNVDISKHPLGFGAYTKPLDNHG